MRRGSIVFPLILIAIGGLFLVNNLRPELSVLSAVAQYWPYLLIGWGLLRCAELLMSYSQGRALPMTGMSGGEWFLVIFVSLAGSGLFFANRLSTNWPAGRINVRGLELLGESYDFPVNGSAAAGTATRVVVENLRGNARIVGGDTTEIKVSGRNTVRAFNDADAKRYNEQMPLEVLNQGGQIVIRTNQERASGANRVSADIDITVPKTMAVQCRGRYGDFDITGVSGVVDVDSDNAGVRLQDIANDVRIDLRRSDIVRAVNVKGGIEIKGRGDDLELENVEGQVNVIASYSGDIQFRNCAKPVHYKSSVSDVTIEKIPGFLRFTRGELTASRIVGPIRIDSETKDINISEFTNSLDVSVNRGDIELRPGKLPLGSMSVRTRNGDIELALPEASKFDLRATTDRGEVENDFGGGLKADSSGRGGSIRGVVGQGPILQVETSRGKVYVRKSSVSEMPSEPLPTPAKPPRAPSAPAVPTPPAPVTQQ